VGIYVWGTGCGASELVDRGLAPERIEAFVDRFPTGNTFLGRPVLSPEGLKIHRCELLIVTTRHRAVVEERCRALGVPAERILYLKDSWRLTDRNACCTVAEKLLGRELLTRLLTRPRVVPIPAQLAGPILPEDTQANDYVRTATLELLCRRLGTVPGAAAELGVYRGEFARCINRLLPARTLYLFDSFQGFPAEACPSEAFQAAHRNTAEDRVLASMPHPERVVVRAGFFPDTARGLEERFCLVSLDVDFYDTTLAGLRYFWPRLSPGGYLLLHDWGSPGLPGPARALTSFERELGAPPPAVPLCDMGGTLVLCKP